jgi:hypothetical protein
MYGVMSAARRYSNIRRRSAITVSELSIEQILPQEPLPLTLHPRTEPGSVRIELEEDPIRTIPFTVHLRVDAAVLLQGGPAELELAIVYVVERHGLKEILELREFVTEERFVLTEQLQGHQFQEFELTCCLKKDLPLTCLYP